MPFIKKKGYSGNPNMDGTTDDRKELLYSGTKDIGNGIYDIEIFTTREK
jgi:hypothetical protein